VANSFTKDLISGKIRDKASWDEFGRKSLNDLLQNRPTLSFPAARVPIVSIIVVLHNKADLSLLSLQAIRDSCNVPYELVIVDNQSIDSTSMLLDHCRGAKIIRNDCNVGFGAACMQATDRCTARFLLFLNNDALLHDGAVTAALANFQDESIGAVGGKILLANGDLQEAGSILWADGSALGYGRSDNPSRLQYVFRRQVDYCSGAFLFTPRELFLRLGGFELAYSPAYYEDTDYCMKLWQAGFKVLYEPQAMIHHYESASSGDNEAARPSMAEKQKVFVSRWKETLSTHLPQSPRNVLRARVAAHFKGLHILYLDDRIPHCSLGSGFPRSNEILNQLSRQHHVTCAPLAFSLEDVESEYRDIHREVEFLDTSDLGSGRFQEYISMADVVWVSRPHNFATMLDWLIDKNETTAKLIFDAEAIFGDRERLGASVINRSISQAVMQARLKRELALAGAADAVIVVSPRDQERLRQEGVMNVHLLGHCLEPQPTMKPFSQRQTFLFVGAVHGPENPNADSMRFFCRQIWPRVHTQTGADLIIAGFGTDKYLGDLNGTGIKVLGSVPKLAPLYEEARVVVVPTRYAAGMPFKAHEAASYGVPMVVSNLIGEQLSWEHHSEVLIASDSRDFINLCCRLYDSDELWQTLRANSLTRIICEFDRGAFGRKIAEILQSVDSRRSRAAGCGLSSLS
jgi:GT2 family glycosyltransferase